jgi:hypothetical protein
MRRRLGRLSEKAQEGGAVRLAIDHLNLEGRAQARNPDFDDGAVVAAVRDKWLDTLASLAESDAVLPDERELIAEMRELAGQALAEDPFAWLLDAVSQKAAAVYGVSWRTARLALAQSSVHPRPQADPTTDPYSITGATPLTPVEPVEVELTLCPQQFSPAAFLVVPSILAHECVCHVPACQSEVQNDSEFSEGFMDWAAAFFWDMWAPGVDSELAASARRHAQAFQQLLRTRANPLWACRDKGHTAAEELQVWLEANLGLSRAEAAVSVARLAVESNIADTPLTTKECLVSSLSQPFPPDLERALREWVNHEIDSTTLLTRSVTA